MKKKVVVTLLTVFMLFSLCFSVNAESTPSVSYKSDVSLIGGSNDGRNDTISYYAEDGCYVTVKLTSYMFKNSIEEEQSKIEIEQAYQEISNAENVTDFAPVLKGYGRNFGIEDTCMIASNIFDISTTHVGSSHDGSNHRRLYNIQLTADSLKYFICLLHYDYANDKWEIVKDARVTGEYHDILTFSYDSCSPFAIISCGAGGSCQLKYRGVVNTGSNGPVSETIKPTYFYVLLAALVLSTIFNVYFILKTKKK